MFLEFEGCGYQRVVLLLLLLIMRRSKTEFNGRINEQWLYINNCHCA